MHVRDTEKLARIQRESPEVGMPGREYLGRFSQLLDLTGIVLRTETCDVGDFEQFTRLNVLKNDSRILDLG